MTPTTTRAIQRKMVPASRVTKILQHHQGKRRRRPDEGNNRSPRLDRGAEKKTVIHDESTSYLGNR
jgi:hypothetical protein